MTKDTAKAKLEYPTGLSPLDIKLLLKDLYNEIEQLKIQIRKLSTDRPKVGRPPREDLPSSGVQS